jgi:DNA-directed RNA polymerase specialized sigma24 family protein
MIKFLNRIDGRPGEIARIQSQPIAMRWTDELRKMSEINPNCKLLGELLGLDLCTRTVVYPLLIKGWAPRRISDRLKVSINTVQGVLEIGREQLMEKLATPR